MWLPKQYKTCVPSTTCNCNNKRVRFLMVQQAKYQSEMQSLIEAISDKPITQQQQTTTTKTTTVLRPLSRTTQVNRYQNKYSLLSWTSTILYHFYQLPPSTTIHNILLFQFMCLTVFCTTSLQVLFGLPLGLEPSTSYSIHLFTQSLSSFRNTCPCHHNLFCYFHHHHHPCLFQTKKVHRSVNSYKIKHDKTKSNPIRSLNFLLGT